MFEYNIDTVESKFVLNDRNIFHVIHPRYIPGPNISETLNVKVFTKFH